MNTNSIFTDECKHVTYQVTSMELDIGDKHLLRKAYDRITSANEIMRFLAEHFRDKYGLTPDNEITPDGKIITLSTLGGEEELSYKVRE